MSKKPTPLPDHAVFLCGQKTGYLTPNNTKVWMPELNDWSGGLSTGLFLVGNWYAVPHGICVPIAELEGSEKHVDPLMTPKTAPTPKFAIGDVVQLKSGGPLMTVSEHDLTFGTVLSKWFDDSCLCESWFHYLTLMKVEVCNAPL